MLSYLNTRAAVRSGFQPSANGGAGVIDGEDAAALYSTMRDLLRQARRCMKQVERELHEPQVRRASAAQRQVPRAQPMPVSVKAGVPAAAYECAEGEPCEPWLYWQAIENGTAGNGR